MNMINNSSNSEAVTVGHCADFSVLQMIISAITQFSVITSYRSWIHRSR